MTPIDWNALLPSLSLFLTACVLLTLGLFVPEARGERRSFAIGLAGLAASGFFAVQESITGSIEGGARGGFVLFDPCAAFLHLVILVSTGASMILCAPFLRRSGAYHAEFPALFLFAASGMSLFVSTTDLLMLFLALELLSLPIYVLAGYQRALPRSNEAALKYFVLGAFSSALFLYGIALVYGATGATDLAALAPRPGTGHLLPVGLLFILSGFLFKIAAAPFHMWAPDVYEGAPTPVTTFMATAVKTAGFGALLRFVWALAGRDSGIDLVGALSLLAILTMTVGNLGALTQPDVKRMLAFSSVAHAGYLLVGLAAVAAGGGRGDAGPVLFYLLAYSITSLAAFGVVIALGERGANLHGYHGLAAQRPGTAALMLLFLLALTGLPPTAGFAAKFVVIQSAVRTDHVALAVLAVICSVVSAFVYMRIAVLMYMKDPEEPAPPRLPLTVSAALTVTALVTLVGGIAPGSLASWTVPP